MNASPDSRGLAVTFQIDYEEFVHAMVLYCMYTRDEILHCACLPLTLRGSESEY